MEIYVQGIPFYIKWRALDVKSDGLGMVKEGWE